MSDYSGGPGQSAWGQGGYSEPNGHPDLPVYPSQASQLPPYQQPVQPVSGYPGYPPPGYPAGYAPQYDPYGRPLSDKSKVIAGVLGITLGGFGAARFYTGHTGIAVAQLVVTLATCGLGSFWGLIDGILLLINGGTDAQGRVLRN